MEVNYDLIADRYDYLFQDDFSKKENDYIASRLRDIKGKILDIGCGTGLLLDLIHIERDNYTGVDPSKKMLDKFKSKHSKYVTVNSKFKASDFKDVDYYISLFGSISYVEKNELELINKDKRMFLMFYKEDYFPKTYKLTGIEYEHFKYSKEYLCRVFAGCRIEEYNNYYIITNL